MNLGAWEVASAPPGEVSDPARLAELEWAPARVPGHTGGDDRDWWFRARFNAEAPRDGERLTLCCDGLATVCEVFVNGASVLASESMWVAHETDIGGFVRSGENEVTIRCQALDPLLAEPRKPRARWRTRLARDGNLRWWRTTLLGRAPGFAPAPPLVGPWRAVRLERRSGPRVDDLELHPHVEGEDGVLTVRGRITGGEAAEVRLAGQAAPLGPDGAEVRVPGAAHWWPHTHGEPALHEVEVLVDGAIVASRRIGFRTLETGDDPLGEGLAIRINGVSVFARGAVWTPVAADELRPTLERVRDAGMNMLRLPGFSVYESAEFHDLCDKLGILVWQDFMFANLDYPVQDDGFRVTVEHEARQVMAGVAWRPSLTVICGNSEVEQQVAMLGLDPALGRGELFGELLPRLVAESGADAAYVPSAPCGEGLPMRPGRGVANYYGVGGYRRPLEDARRADVRFAAECLAFANLGDEGPAGPAAGVPRDVGSNWDFAGVRDFYLGLLYDVEPEALRRDDPQRYLELSRLVTGEVMAEVFGEWRRARSRCSGGLVLWLRDLQAGAGWGALDHAGVPKAAYFHLKRALAPVAVWSTDEGLGGIAAHVANDRPDPLEAILRIRLHRADGTQVGEAADTLALAPHETIERDVEALLGRFADVSWAYRFGPPAQDAIVLGLEAVDGELLSQSVRFPTGRPLERLSAQELGLAARAVRQRDDGGVWLTLASERFLYGVRVGAGDWTPQDDAFCLAPGERRSVWLAPRTAQARPGGVDINAVNLDGTLRVRL